MRQPELLDLCAGAGGCSVGYARAGFHVTPVDIEPHSDHPFAERMIIADALDVLADTAFLSRFAVIHASFPCQRWSLGTKATGEPEEHPDLITPGRVLLQAWGGVYVMENVQGAPLDHPVMICGQGMGLRGIRRHRMFESNVALWSPGCACHSGGFVSVFGHSGEDRRRATVREHGRILKHVAFEVGRDLMEVGWMTRREDVADAIPPVYTEYIGAQLIDYLEASNAEA